MAATPNRQDSSWGTTVEQISVTGSGLRTGDREPTVPRPGRARETLRRWPRPLAGSVWDSGWPRLRLRPA